MKLCFFRLMPYRFRPDDFERTYRSVWVDMPHHLHDADKTRGLYQEFLDELEFVEAQGVDGLCVKERGPNLVTHGSTFSITTSDASRYRIRLAHRARASRMSFVYDHRTASDLRLRETVHEEVQAGLGPGQASAPPRQTRRVGPVRIDLATSTPSLAGHWLVEASARGSSGQTRRP
jgi:hypothetical protein